VICGYKRTLKTIVLRDAIRCYTELGTIEIILTMAPRASARMYFLLGPLLWLCGVILLPALVHARVCSGTNNGMSRVGQTTEASYNYYERVFSGCTRVDGNVEITHIDHQFSRSREGDPSFFSFLRQIEEIRGYLLIYRVRVGYLPFDNLKVIRGQSLYGRSRFSPKPGDPFAFTRSPDFAVYVRDTHLRVLQWTNLHEIQKGRVAFIGNYDLCYEETIDWNDILDDGYFESNLTTLRERPRKCPRCHPACEIEPGKRRCWGGGPDMCQTLNKVICHDSCLGRRCFGRNKDQCCSAQCGGGCTGRLPTDCFVCAALDNDGTCVSS